MAAVDARSTTAFLEGEQMKIWKWGFIGAFAGAGWCVFWLTIATFWKGMPAVVPQALGRALTPVIRLLFQDLHHPMGVAFFTIAMHALLGCFVAVALALAVRIVKWSSNHWGTSRS